MMRRVLFAAGLVVDWLTCPRAELPPPLRRVDEVAGAPQAVPAIVGKEEVRGPCEN